MDESTDESPTAAESSDERITNSESTMETLFDPESLRGREEVEFHETTTVFDPEEFDAIRDDLETLDSHVVIGVTNDVEEVLLIDDGSHGWTLTAVPSNPARIESLLAAVE